MKTKRISMTLLLAGAALATTTLAVAKPADGAGHHGKGKGAFFQKADKNKDGFLTKDEVGDKRWERIKVADANRDNKVTKPELQQARKDGKLPRKNKA